LRGKKIRTIMNNKQGDYTMSGHDTAYPELSERACGWLR